MVSLKRGARPKDVYTTPPLPAGRWARLGDTERYMGERNVTLPGSTEDATEVEEEEEE